MQLNASRRRGEPYRSIQGVFEDRAPERAAQLQGRRVRIGTGKGLRSSEQGVRDIARFVREELHFSAQAAELNLAYERCALASTLNEGSVGRDSSRDGLRALIPRNFDLKLLGHPVEDQRLLKMLVQDLMTGGDVAGALANLSVLERVTAGSGQQYGISGQRWQRLRATVLTVGAHTAYRLGLPEPEQRLLKKVSALTNDADGNLHGDLVRSLLMHKHLGDMKSSAAYSALESIRTSDPQFRSPQTARFLIYSVEAALHQGQPLLNRSFELGMTPLSAIEKAIGHAHARGDYDGAARFRTVLMRAHLLNGLWEAAHEEALTFQQDVQDMPSQVPHAVMRHKYELYVTHMFRAKEGIKGASRDAEIAFQEAVNLSRALIGAPILTQSHKIEYKALSKRFDIVLKMPP